MKDTNCTKACKKGPKSGCPTQGRGKPKGNLSCREVDRRLKALGVDGTKASLCVKSAIMNGIIEITGKDKEELNQVIWSGEIDYLCGHTITATLGDLLMQPDYGGNDYEDGSYNATVVCKECEEDPEVEEEHKTYITGICRGQPEFSDGKFHNHCNKCPGFGMCIGDYREAHCNKCKKHYFRGLQGFSCPCKSKGRGGRKRGWGWGLFGLGL